MNCSWKPQVKKPSTSSTYDRWPNASASAWRNDCDAAGDGVAAAAAAFGGVASATDSGNTSARLTANMVSAFCQPNTSLSATASGEYRNWPNEPAAVPAPNANERQFSGSSLPNADTMI